MTRDYLNFSNAYNIDRTSETTINNGYLALKQGVITSVKNAITAANLGFTLVSETAPTADAVNNTIYLLYDTNLALNAMSNYQFRITIAFPHMVYGGNITITSELTLNGVYVALHSIVDIGSFVGNPVTVNVDINSILVKTPNVIAIGIIRSNFVVVSQQNVFPTNIYSVIRYRELRTGLYYWGVISSVGVWLQNISSAIANLGYSIQTQYGFMVTGGTIQQLLSMSEVYWNEQPQPNTQLLYSTESDSEFIYATSPQTPITQGNIVSVDGEPYYLLFNFVGKCALAKITS